MLVGLSTSAIAILITYTLTSLFYTPLMPLAETYALKGLAARGRAYGPVRLWGSFAFIFGNLAAGLAADVIPARNLIWLMAAASVLIALAAWKLQPLSLNAPEHVVPDVTRPASLRDPAFVAVFAGAKSHSGEPCVVLRLFRAAMARGGVRRHFHRCVVGAGCRGRDRAVCGAGPPAALFLTNDTFDGWRCGRRVALVGNGDRSLCAGAALVAVLHALSFGATHLGALMFLAQNAPAGQAATAQGYLAIAAGLAMAAATGISGVLYQDFGSRAYVAMALVAFAGGTCGFVAHRTRRNATG